VPSRSAKARLRARNIEELKALKEITPGLEILEFQSFHLRLIGTRAVDFWPTTGTAWVVHDYANPSKVMTAAQAVALAFSDSPQTQSDALGVRNSGETHGA